MFAPILCFVTQLCANRLNFQVLATGLATANDSSKEKQLQQIFLPNWVKLLWNSLERGKIAKLVSSEQNKKAGAWMRKRKSSNEEVVEDNNLSEEMWSGEAFLWSLSTGQLQKKKEREETKTVTTFVSTLNLRKKLNPDVLANILNESERWEKCNWLIAVQAYLSINWSLLKGGLIIHGLYEIRAAIVNLRGFGL